MPLKNRNGIFPPAGFLFFEPKTGWNAPGGVTFSECVSAIIQHRLANPRFKDQWLTDVEGVSDELDNYTCLRIGNDPNYCNDESPPPSFRPGFGHLHRQSPRIRQGVGAAVGSRLEKVTAGIGVLIDWLGDGGKPVAHELAEKRAGICATCPKNGKANTLEKVFTIPAMTVLRKQLAIRSDMKLETTHDNELGICEGCWCVLKLSCHTPLEHKLKHMTPEILAALDPRCWVLSRDA